MMTATIRDCPVPRRQAQELRRRQGRRRCAASRRSSRSATAPSRSSPTVSGTPRRRSRRCRSSGTRGRTPRSAAPISPAMLQEGLDAKDAFVGNKAGDAAAALAGAAKVVEAVYSYPVPEPRADGADERDRALHGRKMRGLVPDAERRGDAGRCGGRRRFAGREMRRLQDAFSAAASGGAAPASDYARQAVHDREADAGHAGQADLDARRGHDARFLSPDHAMQIARRARRVGQSGRAAYAHLGTVDPRCAAAAEP